MREKNRKPIASYIKLPQFTTMNVIDGQAGVIIYSSLICYSLTIDNILNIIVLLILAGITVASLSGNNGLIDKTSEAQFRTEIAQYQEDLDLSIIKEEGKYKRGRTSKFNATSYDDIKKIIPSFDKKYENSLAIEEDKLVYKGNNKDLYKISYEMGLISSDDLLDDEILEELQPFITEWTVADNDTITLPVAGCNFTVDYGDGTGNFEVTSNTDEDRIHTYTTAGTYKVTIKGECSSFSTKNKEGIEKISKIVQFGNTGFTNLNFYGCLNIEGSIPQPSKNSFSKLTSFSQTFQNCSKITGSIPEKLFYNCPDNTSFEKTFYGCSGLTGEIPQDLFKRCTEVTTFSNVFYNCSNLTGEIPEQLFKNNVNTTSLAYAFYGCKNLTGNIPGNLFENNTEILSVVGLFHSCSGLIGNIPENLFKTCTKLTNISQTFQNCSKITGSIPEKLFYNCPDNTSFEKTFYQCSGLTGEIPQNLFNNNLNVTNFSNTFCNCKKLTGNAPSLWNRTNIINSSNCFKNCTNLSNYNQIPSSWGGGGT